MEDIKFENVLKIKMETPGDNILLTLYIIKKLLNDNSLIQKFYEIMNKGNEIPTMLETCGNNTLAKIASCGYFYCYNGLPSKWSNNQKSDSNVVISFIENINTSSNTPENILKNFICYSNCIRGVSEEIIKYWTSLIDNTIPDIFYTKMGEKYREEHEVMVPTIDINTDSFEIKDMEEYTKFIRDNRGLYARNGITIPSAIFNIRANTVSLLSPSQINDHINPDITNVDKFEHITQKEIIEIPGTHETVVENKTNEPEEPEEDNYLDNEPEEIENDYNEPEEDYNNNYLDNEPDISEDYEFDYNENIPETPENTPEMNERPTENTSETVDKPTEIVPKNKSDDLLENMNDQIDDISENIPTDYSFDNNENNNENDISTDYSFDNNENDNNENDNNDVIENDISTDYSFDDNEEFDENNENDIENDISTDYSFNDEDNENIENDNNDVIENDISTDYSFDENNEAEKY